MSNNINRHFSRDMRIIYKRVKDTRENDIYSFFFAVRDITAQTEDYISQLFEEYRES